MFQRLVEDDLASMPFMSAKPMTVGGIEGCFVARSGYTGEDGFEIAVPKGSAVQHGVVKLWNALLDHEVLQLPFTARIA